MAAQFMRDGFLHVPNALTPEERDHCLEVMGWSVAHPSKFTGDGKPTDESVSIHIKNTWNTEHRTGRGEEFAQRVLNMMTQFPVCDVAEAVLGEDCHLHGTSCWTTRPGRPTQGLHVDYVPIDWGEQGADLLGSGTVQMPFMVLTAHYYLDDLYEELGCVRLRLCAVALGVSLPPSRPGSLAKAAGLCWVDRPTKFIAGSHLSGRGPKTGEETWNGKPAQALLVKGGDCVLFVSTVWHFGSANTSQDTRHMMQFHYSNRWIHRHFQPYLDSLGASARMEQQCIVLRPPPAPVLPCSDRRWLKGWLTLGLALPEQVTTRGSAIAQRFFPRRPHASDDFSTSTHRPTA